MAYIIGIDGGGTKTHAVVASMDATVLGEGFGGPANLHTVALDVTKSSIREAVEDAKKAAGVHSEPEAVCLGIAGLDASSDQLTANGLLEELFPGVSHRKAVNDTVIARRSNSELPYGFALIGGTGSNAFAVNEEGEEAFTGGLGHILADEGSAYAFGLAALRAATCADDGRQESRLCELVKEKLGVASMREAVPIVHADDFGKAEIAAFAPLVDAAADEDDAVAQGILEQGANDLTRMVITLAKKLCMEDARCDLVTIGSQINNSTGLRKRFEQHIKDALPNVRLVQKENEAVIGAVRMAKDLLNRI